MCAKEFFNSCLTHNRISLASNQRRHSIKQKFSFGCLCLLLLEDVLWRSSLAGRDGLDAPHMEKVTRQQTNSPLPLSSDDRLGLWRCQRRQLSWPAANASLPQHEILALLFGAKALPDLRGRLLPDSPLLCCLLRSRRNAEHYHFALDQQSMASS